MKVVIVIPAFNEAETIVQVVNEVKQYGQPIVIDDCSTDETYIKCISEGVDVVQHTANLGYDAALQSGFEHAIKLDANIVITFDADGQHTASVLREVLEPLLSGKVDMILGIRSTGFARISESTFSFYTKLRFGVDDILCGLKGYNIKLYMTHGCFDSVRSIGTELALSSLKRGVCFQQVHVPTRQRIKGITRFGSSFGGNISIFRAFLIAIWADFYNNWD